jgi:hypothetical protein
VLRQAVGQVDALSQAPQRQGEKATAKLTAETTEKKKWSFATQSGT